MRPYAVELDAVPPEVFDRVQVGVRVVIVLVIGWLGISLGWMFFLLYLALPVVAAIFVSNRGPELYLGEIGPKVTRVVRWLVAFHGYMILLLDRFPIREPYEGFRLEVRSGGRPSSGSALVKLLTSIPPALILVLLGFASWLVAIVAAIYVLVRRSYPSSLYRYQRGLARWEARLLAYHASLVEAYPPLAFDGGREPVRELPDEQREQTEARVAS